MKKLSDFIVKHRLIVTIATIVLVILGILGTVFIVVGGKINSDMLVYLPKNTSTSDGIKFLKENFDVEGDAFVVVNGVENDKELSESISKMKKEIDGITQFVWYGDVENMETLFGWTNKIKADEIKDYLRRPITDEDGEIIGYNYVLLVLFSYSPSTQEAFNVHKQIREELGGNLGRSVAISGMTALADTVLTETMAEIPYYLIFSIIIVLVILLLATDSFFDPAILLITMGIAIIINMGSNIILPDISIISFAASSVLQLGITMDYAIFLLHAYKEDLKSGDPIAAVESALPRTMVNILASSLTTIGGFAALYFMRFTIGADLANVIIKGVVLSLITVVFVQPCLIIYFDKPTTKLAHKKLYINVEPMVNGIMKGRYVIAVVAVLLIVPAFLGQHFVSFSYLKIYDEPSQQTAQEALAESLQNQIILAVPLDTKEGEHSQFMKDLVEDEKIDSVIGAFSVLEVSDQEMKDMLDINVVSSMSLVKALFRKIDTGSGERWYTLYLVETVGDTEDKAAFDTHAYLRETLDKYFDESYPLGILTGVADMASVTPGDFLRVTLMSISIILIIMSILLKSVRKSVLMVALIELAVWLNIALSTAAGRTVNFMIYIIISSVQLGCTVDYAILLSTRFEEAKLEYSDTKTAIIKATSSAFPSISVSASIIITVCMAIFIISNNLLVKEMAMLLSRGAFISYVLVIFVLPCLLIFFKRIKPINLRGHKQSEEEDSEQSDGISA